MENYGEILRHTREEKHLEIETIVRETSISQRYLEALESEEAHVFPSEPYLIGFLKNYAEYLGLNSKQIVSLYNAKKIQEAPPPAALTAHERPKFLIPLLIVLGVAVVAAGVFALVSVIKAHRPQTATPNVALDKPSASKKYELSEEPFSGRVFKNDQFVLGMEGGNVVLTVAQTTDVFGIETPAGVQFVELSEQMEMDANGDSMPDLVVYVKDLSAKGNDHGAEVNIMIKNASNAAIADSDESQIQSTADLPKDKKWTEILSDTRAYPFTLNVTFRAGCLFRYRTDRKDTVEDYLANGDVLNLTASNALRVWMSNGNTAKLQVVANGKNYDLPLSKAGAVVAEDIKWIKDTTDGKFRLVVLELD